MAASFQVRDLHLKAGQHSQVLVLQEGDAPLHSGHLLLQPPSSHGSTLTQPAHRRKNTPTCTTQLYGEWLHYTPPLKQ